jgi:hypothetical protein
MGSSSGALNFSRIQSVMLLLSMLACDYIPSFTERPHLMTDGIVVTRTKQRL